MLELETSSKIDKFFNVFRTQVDTLQSLYNMGKKNFKYLSDCIITCNILPVFRKSLLQHAKSHVKKQMEVSLYPKKTIR